MKKLILSAFLFLTACVPAPSTPMPTETPNPGEIALQMVQQQMAAEATQQVVALQFTATAQVIGQTSTVQAYGTQQAITQQARLDAQATADQARRDAQATQQRIDAEATQRQTRLDAQATADQARLDLQATQQAQASLSAFLMTQVVMPTHQYWTQQAVEQDIKIATNEVELSNLAVQQQQETNTVDWAFPLGAASVLMIALLFYLYKHSQMHDFKNADGDTDVIVYKNRAFRPALMPKPVLMLDDLTMPDMTTPDNQAEIVRRDQAIRALANMPVNPTGAGAQTFNKFFAQPEKPAMPFEIVDAESLPAGLLDGEALKAIEKDWREANEPVS